LDRLGRPAGEPIERRRPHGLWRLVAEATRVFLRGGRAAVEVHVVRAPRQLRRLGPDLHLDLLRLRGQGRRSAEPHDLVGVVVAGLRRKVRPREALNRVPTRRVRHALGRMWLDARERLVRREPVDLAIRVVVPPGGEGQPPRTVLLGEVHAEQTARRLGRFVEDVGGLQLDAINVLARAHYMTVWSRFGPYDRARLDRLVYRRRLLFEYWAHAACLVPTSMLPWWRRAMLDYRIRHTGWSDWLRRNARVLSRVKAAVEANGPMGNADFDGRRPAGGGWWSWRPVQHALHY